MFAPLFSVLSPTGARARLSIMIFHRVLATRDPLFPDEPDAERFDQLLGWIQSWFNVLPLDEGAKRLRTGSLPARAAALTFDDGYADNFDIALPILRAHGLSATFFIATGYIDGGRMWNDTIIESVRRTKLSRWDLSAQGLSAFELTTDGERRRAIDKIIGAVKHLPPEERSAVTAQIADEANVPLPNDLMMTSDNLVDMRRAGMQIGAHTVTHPILARLEDRKAEQEISGSKAFLEGLLGERIGLFAYPNGKPAEDWRPEHAAMVRRLGFEAAVSTAPGTATRNSDPMQLPRFTPWDRTRARFGLRLAANLAGMSA
jgi:peptidoglycan/xylan/chitin deacetylase (PgdA/CDA1 family)